MATQYFEIYFKQQRVNPAEWKGLFSKLSSYHGILDSWKVIALSCNNSKIRFFIETNRALSPYLDESGLFLLRRVTGLNFSYRRSNLITPCFLNLGGGLSNVINYLTIRKQEKFLAIEISFFKVNNSSIITRVYTYSLARKNIHGRIFACADPISFLAFDFANNRYYSCKNLTKVLDSSKALRISETNLISPIFEIESYQFGEKRYIDETCFDIDKHSVIIGASGSGKSKLISLIVEKLYQNVRLKQGYKIIIVDPHANIENDLNNISKIIDFTKEKVNLFDNDTHCISTKVDMFLELFKSFMPHCYNAKTERVLRFSVYLLLKSSLFNLNNLKRVLVDLEFRESAIERTKHDLPITVILFFKTDFNELKTTSYEEAILPIINLIDEIDMSAIFDYCDKSHNLEKVIRDNFITLFSLDKSKLGTSAVRITTGLIMQQIFEITQRHAFNEHIIVIIDEISVVENPILAKMLSEARKYNVSLIFAGQYFNQISSSLRDAISANVVNYFIFRTSRPDASILVNSIDINLIVSNTIENKINLISNLNNRSCIIRISKNGKLIPAFMGITAEYKNKGGVGK